MLLLKYAGQVLFNKYQHAWWEIFKDVPGFVDSLSRALTPLGAVAHYVRKTEGEKRHSSQLKLFLSHLAPIIITLTARNEAFRG